MKKSILTLFTLTSLLGFSQESEYKLSSYLTEGTKAPNTHYIGEAWLNAIIHDDTELGYNITKATFKANSTLDWHKHSSAQVLIIMVVDNQRLGLKLLLKNIMMMSQKS